MTINDTHPRDTKGRNNIPPTRGILLEAPKLGVMVGGIGLL